MPTNAPSRSAPVVCLQCEAAQPAPQCRRCGAPLRLPPASPVGLTLRQAERQLIQHTIAQHPVATSAKLLGTSRPNLYRLIKQHRLNLPST